MPIQALPLELVMMVIEAVPSKNDLSSLSLVSTLFLPLVRPILFSSCRIRFQKSPEERRVPNVTSEDPQTFDFFPIHRTHGYCKDFISFLDSAPELALLIRDLTLWSGTWDTYDEYAVLESMNMALFDSMVSKLRFLRSLWLHNISFRTSDTPVPRRYDHIDSLTLSCTSMPEDVILPLCFFSHIDVLSLISPPLVFAEPSHASFQRLLEEFEIAHLFKDELQVYNIHLDYSERWQPEPEPWVAMVRQTRTPTALRSFYIHCDEFTAKCLPSSGVFDLLREAASTLTHLTLGTGDRSPDTSLKFESAEMRPRLAPLTALRSVTLRMRFQEPQPTTEFARYDTFASLITILAAFPPCLRRITLSFAKPAAMYVDAYSASHLSFCGGSWLWEDINIGLLAPLLQRYEQLEAVVFEGAEGVTSAERARILKDLPEFKERIEFVE